MNASGSTELRVAGGGSMIDTGWFAHLTDAMTTNIEHVLYLTNKIHERWRTHDVAHEGSEEAHEARRGNFKIWGSCQHSAIGVFGGIVLGSSTAYLVRCYGLTKPRWWLNLESGLLSLLLSRSVWFVVRNVTLPFWVVVCHQRHINCMKCGAVDKPNYASSPISNYFSVHHRRF